MAEMITNGYMITIRRSLVVTRAMLRRLTSWRCIIINVRF